VLELPHAVLGLAKGAALEGFGSCRIVFSGIPDAVLVGHSAAFDLDADNSLPLDNNDEVDLAEFAGPAAGKTQRMEDGPIVSMRCIPQRLEDPPLRTRGVSRNDRWDHFGHLRYATMTFKRSPYRRACQALLSH